MLNVLSGFKKITAGGNLDNVKQAVQLSELSIHFPAPTMQG